MAIFSPPSSILVRVSHMFNYSLAFWGSIFSSCYFEELLCLLKHINCLFNVFRIGDLRGCAFSRIMYIHREINKN